MADTSKEGLLLDGKIRHITATSQFTRGSKQVPVYVISFYGVNFRQYFVCLCERILKGHMTRIFTCKFYSISEIFREK